ncbi:MAG: bifunctional diguanylate cyclase/phosphodiesterase [Candidatus Viridilinea halotolerans]|uniref:Bifunctional diguanylate cyclase/phosphodiesterase n=1 Tax=Candidatus Viridilinea halotolerans TaxID=2491704 RepID=A0A426U9Q6_9CHLR|nr:MAG: bifunctional diguanylate cyclase/phosphodiesterase [Candidatus Viridilinea halotolerans]
MLEPPDQSAPEPQTADEDIMRRMRFFSLAHELLATTDLDGHLRDMNQAWASCLGLNLADLVGVALPSLLHPEDQLCASEAFSCNAPTQGVVHFEARCASATGEICLIAWSLSRDPQGQICYLIGRDITAQRQMERALRESELRFHQLVDASLDAVCVLDVREKRVLFFNRAEFCGYRQDELGMAALDYIHSDDRQHVRDHYRRLFLRGLEATGAHVIEYRFWRRDGGLEWIHSRSTVLGCDHDGMPRQVVVMLRLITDRKHSQQLLDYQAHYDPVTGLPNRFAFTDRLEQQVVAARAVANTFALCMIDLDHFSQINDSLGHTAGDEVLAQVADRLRQTLGPTDLLSRLGGDEFAVILQEAPSAAQIAQTALRLLAMLEEPITIGSHELFVSASMGISLYPSDGLDATTLLKHADSALYRAKATGRNGVSWFVPELGRATLARLELGNQLRRAITQRQFELHYQPQICLATGRVIGVESLIRWHHPERGLLPPGQFIPVAEESYLMSRISAWVLQEACRQAAAWHHAGYPRLRLAVNISARQFERDDVIQLVSAALWQSGFDPSWLDLEITESVLMHDPEGSARRIIQLRAMGVRIAIDDFGTGYSSLAYLQRFPVDTLKIDRSFVAALGNDSEVQRGPSALIQAIIALAHSLHLTVVAEGVETPAQHALLRELGCDEAQGYLFAYPLPADDLWAIVQTLGVGIADSR